MSEEAEQGALGAREGVENVPDRSIQPGVLNRWLDVPFLCNQNLERSRWLLPCAVATTTAESSARAAPLRVRFAQLLLDAGN